MLVCNPIVNSFDEIDLVRIRENPHLLGLMAGKDKLTELHSRWMLYIWDTKKTRSLQAHRGSYKTTAICVIGAVWWLLFNPNDRIAIVRKTFTDAANVVNTIAQVMDIPEIQALFKQLYINDVKFTVRRNGGLTFNFKDTLTPEGSITAHGLDLGLTGKHYDRILCDDFVTLKDRISKAEREKTKDIIREIRTNIIDPKKPVSFVGTPWHKQDGWSLCPRALKYNVRKCKLLSEEEVAEKKKITTPSLYAANYELRHISDEDLLFTDPRFGRWKFVEKEMVVGHLDAAFDGDHTNALTFMCKKSTGEFQAVGFVYPGNVKKWYDFIVKKYKYYKCERLYMEDNADKGFTADMLKTYGLAMKTYHESKNKHHKIATHLYNYWNEIIWDIATEDNFMEQIVDYLPEQEPDDSPDSVASLICEAYTNAGSEGELWKW